MSDRRVSIRLGIDGKADVTRDIKEITDAGSSGFNELGQKIGATTAQAELHRQKLNEIAAAARQAEASHQALSQAISAGTQILSAFGLALSAETAVQWTRAVFASTADLENQSRVLGISTDALQAYHAAAIMSGAGADVADMAIRRFERSVGTANEAMGPQRKAFMDLGLTAQDLAGGAEAVLPKVATALLGIQDAAERARLETILFNRAGQDVNIVLEKWADPELVAHMKEFGVVIDHDLIERAHNAEVAWDTFWLKFKVGLVESVGSAKDAFNNPNAPGFGLIMGPPDISKQPFAGKDSLGIMAAGAAADQAAAAAKIAWQTAEQKKYEEDLLKYHAEEQAVIDKYDQKNAEEAQRQLDILDQNATKRQILNVWNQKLLADEMKIGEVKKQTLDLEIKQISETQFRSDRTAFLTEQFVGRYEEEARIAAELPRQRAIDLALLQAQLDKHVEIGDAERERIVNAVILRQHNEEIVQTEVKMQSTLSSWLKTAETTGKFTFKNLFTGILSDWEDLLNKMISEEAFQKIFGGSSSGGGILGSVLGAFFGGIGGGGAAAAGDVGAVAGGYHTGGMAGEISSTRAFPSSWLAHAPRYHLGVDEVPAILQRGERVLNRSETRAYNSGGAQQVQVNIAVEPSPLFKVQVQSEIVQAAPSIVSASVTAVSKRTRNSNGRI